MAGEISEHKRIIIHKVYEDADACASTERVLKSRAM